jgi:chromosome segregation ATPase
VPDCVRPGPKKEQSNMTPEERFTKMENLLHAMMEHQSRHQQQLERQSQEITRQNEEINKQNAGIRDLIVVSRTILTNTEKVTEQINRLREAQAGTDERLNILIAEVNRVIRALGKNGIA